MSAKSEISTILILVLCSLLSPVYGLRPFVMDFETLKYEFNSNVVKSMTLQLIDYNKHKALNGSFVFSEDIAEFKLIAWTASTRSNGRPWILFNVTLNGCQFLDNTFMVTKPLASIVVKEIKNHTLELPSKCPVRKNKEYTIKNFACNEELFPIYLSEISFSVDVILVRKNIQLFKISLTGYSEAKNGQRYRNRILKSG